MNKTGGQDFSDYEKLLNEERGNIVNENPEEQEDFHLPSIRQSAIKLFQYIKGGYAPKKVDKIVRNGIEEDTEWTRIIGIIRETVNEETAEEYNNLHFENLYNNHLRACRNMEAENKKKDYLYSIGQVAIIGTAFVHEVSAVGEDPDKLIEYIKEMYKGGCLEGNVKFVNTLIGEDYTVADARGLCYVLKTVHLVK